MGGLCGGMPSMPGMPEINVDMEAVQAAVEENMEQLPKEYKKNCDEFPGEIRKADPKDFEVPDTNLKLNKDSTEKEIKTAALTSASSGNCKASIQDAVWEQVSPSLEEQVPENTPEKIKEKALDKIKENTVDPAVDKAWEKALEQLQKKINEESGDKC